MSNSSGYISLAEFKAYKSINDTGNSADDGIIADLIFAASRFIDNMTNQFFYSETGTTRYYTADDARILFTDNISTLTTLKTDDNHDGTFENTWNTGQSTGDFYLMPFNAARIKAPYSWIEANPDGDYTFPVKTKKGVQIIGTFGYPAIPDQIKQACYEIVNAAYGRRSGQNMTGNAEVTAAGIVITPEDISPYARSILRMYQRGY